MNLCELQALSEAAFFADLVEVIDCKLGAVTRGELPPLDVNLNPDRAFGNALAERVVLIESDFVLLIDHLEAIPNDLIQAILRSLRAVYQQQVNESCRLLVVVAGALSLGALTLGPTSPFNIARPVFVGDLTEDQSRTLIAQELAASGIQASPKVRDRLLRAAAGDPTLLQRMCGRCKWAVTGSVGRQVSGVKRLTTQTLRRVIREFSAKDASSYGPLKEGIDLIEHDADLLHEGGRLAAALPPERLWRSAVRGRLGGQWRWGRLVGAASAHPQQRHQLCVEERLSGLDEQLRIR